MPYASRADWGARPPRSVSHAIAPAGWAVHYSATPAPADHARCLAAVRAIQREHMDVARWSDVAYNFVVCPHNWLIEGRGWGVRSAAQGTTAGNDHYLAVCLLGRDVAGVVDLADGHRQALAYVVDHEGPLHKIPRVCRPHSSFHATACPGDEVRAFLRERGWWSG